MSVDQEDMGGRLYMVTGATSGLGSVVALELARQSEHVIIVSRDPRRCARSVARIKRQTGNPAVEWFAADLSSMAEVRNLAARFRRRFDHLNVLINNAGAYYRRRQRSGDGYEMTWALNHLSPFLLTHLLLDLLQAGSPARVINVSSSAHLHGRLDFADLQGERQYDGFRAYAQSKLANLLFTYVLARRLTGTGITVNAVHPGLVATRFGRNNGLLRYLARRLIKRNLISPREGARPILDLVTSPKLAKVTGAYFALATELPATGGAAYDVPSAERLWSLSEEMVGLALPRASFSGVTPR